MTSKISHEEVFADLVQIIQDNRDRLANIYQQAGNVSVVRQSAELMNIDNLRLYDFIQAVWDGMLELARQRDVANRNGIQLTETQIIRNIEYALGTESDEAKIVYQYITGQLTDSVWHKLDNDAKHALRQIACDVQADREERTTPDGYDTYAEVG